MYRPAFVGLDVAQFEVGAEGIEVGFVVALGLRPVQRVIVAQEQDALVLLAPHDGIVSAFERATEGVLNLFLVCGENRIRTCEPVLPVTRFPGVPLQPLEHLSFIFALQRYE